MSAPFLQSNKGAIRRLQAEFDVHPNWAGMSRSVFIYLLTNRKHGLRVLVNGLTNRMGQKQRGPFYCYVLSSLERAFYPHQSPCSLSGLQRGCKKSSGWKKPGQRSTASTPLWFFGNLQSDSSCGFGQFSLAVWPKRRLKFQDTEFADSRAEVSD